MVYRTKIAAIVSDYDGTLTLEGESGNRPAIPKELEHALVQIANQIPVCILSRSDYHFLHDKIPFANIVSCILGIETLVLEGMQAGKMRKVETYHSLLSRDSLRKNSCALNELVCSVERSFPELRTARRFTHDELLASITFDWRHIKNYRASAKTVKEYVRRVLLTESSDYSSSIFTQTYDSYPFLDVHSIKCDKGNGFDSIVTELGKSSTDEILYLGDSENDNPAFRKAGISIGVYKGTGLDPKLDCQYAINHDHLIPFLRKLANNGFTFEEGLLAG